jgi:hypothetical protein
VKQPALNAHNKSSVATDTALPGLVALVRLLARDAVGEAFAQQANKQPTAREIAVPAPTKEQNNGEDRRA